MCIIFSFIIKLIVRIFKIKKLVLNALHYNNILLFTYVFICFERI